MRRIASRQNPIVARYRQAARGDDVLLLDGPHLVQDALAAGVRVKEAAVTVEAGDSAEIQYLLERFNESGVDVVSVTAPVMNALSPVRSSSAIVALADPPDRAAMVFGDGHPDPFVVVAVGVQDPGNLGAVIRVAEAAGATGAIVAGASANPYGWKALRGSMGSALRLPIITGELERALPEIREHRCRIVAAVPRGGRSLFDADLAGPLAILIGGEGAGLPPDALDLADVRVSIPMHTPVESLNTAVSAALLAYEARRQRVHVHRPVAL
ncbi:MAG TPA: RNA methyltransferase [Vicinamibacterales bacterium]|jgi:TrmH family RNA methyltransferase